MASEYPELDKLSAVTRSGASQSIVAFIEWLGEQDISLTEEREMIDEYECTVMVQLPITDSIEKLLARYFDIDLNKVEAEKQRILDTL